MPAPASDMAGRGHGCVGKRDARPLHWLGWFRGASWAAAGVGRSGQAPPPLPAHRSATVHRLSSSYAPRRAALPLLPETGPGGGVSVAGRGLWTDD